ncbi:differentially expressed in FDCP 6 homolog [Galendromus occidentalis]|uniref:Differentially expressed in FDCP 6 homolog n=1 Tax=Galendromus occidentalis TaxID=34638 RepID=A0AAJ6QVU9_9ACAR|nr:differentially expressed in FDCP 6 homolog [Galendromus occidentalis]
MTSLSSDVTNAVWHAYHYHQQILKGCVTRNSLTGLISRIGQVVGAPLVAHTLSLQQTPPIHFGQLMCFLERELFAPFQATCDIKSIQRSRDLIEEACWHEFSPEVMGSRSDGREVLPEKAIYHIFRVFCFLADLQTDPVTGEVNVMMSPDEADGFCRSFAVALGEEWDPSSLEGDPLRKPMSFENLLTFLESHLAGGQDLRGLAEAAAELFDMFVGDVIKKGPIKRRIFGLWWDFVMVVRPHFLQFYNNRGKKMSEFQLTSASFVKNAAPCASAATESISNILLWPTSSQISSRGHKILIQTESHEANKKLIEISAPCYKSKLQWISAIQCAIAHSHSLRRYQSYLASQRKIQRREERQKERAREQEWESSVRSRVKQEVSSLEKEIVFLKLRVEEETKAKIDEEIVRGAQSRLLLEEWDKIEKLQQELEATKSELKRLKCETVSHSRSQTQRAPPLSRAKSWSNLSEPGNA